MKGISCLRPTVLLLVLDHSSDLLECYNSDYTKFITLLLDENENGKEELTIPPNICSSAVTPSGSDTVSLPLTSFSSIHSEIHEEA